MTEPRKLQHRALDRSDDVAAFSAALLGLAGILQVPERLGITADNLAAAIGFLFTIIAFVRGRLEKSYKAWLTHQASQAGVPTARPGASDSDEEVTEPREVESNEPLGREDTPVVGPPPKINN